MSTPKSAEGDVLEFQKIQAAMRARHMIKRTASGDRSTALSSAEGRDGDSDSSPVTSPRSPRSSTQFDASVVTGQRAENIASPIERIRRGRSASFATGARERSSVTTKRSVDDSAPPTSEGATSGHIKQRSGSVQLAPRDGVTAPQPNGLTGSADSILSNVKSENGRTSSPDIRQRSPSPSPLLASGLSSSPPAPSPVMAPAAFGSSPNRVTFSIQSSIPVHSATEKEFTAFMVTVHFPNGEQRTILRRYRQFSALQDAIQKRYPDADLPSFPKKRLIGNMHPSVVEKRRRKLEKFILAIAALPDIEDFLGFTTFLGSDLPQRGTPKHRKKPSDAGLRGGVNSSGEIEDEEEETAEEREQRLAMERRYGEVKQCVVTLDSWIAKLQAIEKAFDGVLETSDFIKLSEYSKLVVALGKALTNEPTEDSFVPRELPKEAEGLILNPKIKSIRQKITPAISELVSKACKVKSRLLDVSFPMDQVLALEQVVDDIKDLWDNTHLIPTALGFRTEGGSTHFDKKLPNYIAENQYWYQNEFVGTDHLICHTAQSSLGPVVIAIKGEQFAATGGTFRGFICTRDGNDHLVFHVNGSDLATTWQEKYQDILLQMDLRFRGIEWRTCPGSDAQQLLFEHEKRDMRITRKLKFGVLFCKKDQAVEEQMFGNKESPPEFEEFLSHIGEKIVLNGWKNFAGGLDTRGENSTGVHSVFKFWRDFQVMFHVSTMLPHGESDQQLAKKRHIGNDIILVVFQEEGSQPFSPTTVKSNYIQIIIVVRVMTIGENKKAYRVTVASAQDVPEFGPALPYPPIFDDGPTLAEWLLEKMINGELGAYRSKLFVQQFRTTFKTLVADLQAKLPQAALKVKKDKGFFSPFAKKSKVEKDKDKEK